MNAAAEVEPRWFVMAAARAEEAKAPQRAHVVYVTKVVWPARRPEPRPPVESSPRTIRCDNCHRKYRGEDDWFVRFYDGYPTVVLCATHAPNDDRQESTTAARQSFFRTGGTFARYVAVHA